MYVCRGERVSASAPGEGGEEGVRVFTVGAWKLFIHGKNATQKQSGGGGEQV